ncbi:hypothetical protein POJ06DRAFT_112097 [Lipomyces tetrasporus]|uniref:Uncharacterized protein n=1 Tax=Lipomyces tetrasporus TaxID=54092 RepID=A0AAD7QSS9_9ASCO|nr:uncharacterized protein POJ06DRAFT_112097 [Lipomyces tetrasporus]KAJ8100819.1 hypothetical protein POJ06DRAFT_112097 [Lipomyces tetrasporus]
MRQDSSSTIYNRGQTLNVHDIGDGEVDKLVLLPKTSMFESASKLHIDLTRLPQLLGYDEYAGTSILDRLILLGGGDMSHSTILDGLG